MQGEKERKWKEYVHIPKDACLLLSIFRSKFRDCSTSHLLMLYSKYTYIHEHAHRDEIMECMDKHTDICTYNVCVSAPGYVYMTIRLRAT